MTSSTAQQTTRKDYHGHFSYVKSTQKLIETLYKRKDTFIVCKERPTQFRAPSTKSPLMRGKAGDGNMTSYILLMTGVHSTLLGKPSRRIDCPERAFELLPGLFLC